MNPSDRLCLLLLTLFSLSGLSPCQFAFGDDKDGPVIMPQVIGGGASPSNSYRWLGALVSLDQESLTEAQFCGCSLIDEYWILTAAHCLDEMEVGQFAVAFGNGDLEGENVVIPVDLVVMHPEYFEVLSLDNDMALARLTRPVEGVEPIMLNEEPGVVLPGMPVKVIGWGMTAPVQDEPERTSTLREANLSVLDRDWVNSEDILDGRVSDRMLAVGSLEPLVASYFGDSGGPMIATVADEDRLVGVTSWGMGCFVEYLPYSMYTDILQYSDWIDSVINWDRKIWKEAYGSGAVGDEDAYRLALTPWETSRDIVSVDRDGFRAEARVRPFSKDWRYEFSYYDQSDGIWRDVDWNFERKAESDGSLKLELPPDAGEMSVLARSRQISQEFSRAEVLEMPMNQVVSGSFGELESPLSGGVRAFRISDLSPDWEYRIRMRSEGGSLNYYLQPESASEEEGQTGQVEGREDIDFSTEWGEVFWLYLVPANSNIQFELHLASHADYGLNAYSTVYSGFIEGGDVRIGSGGHYVDTFTLYERRTGKDVIAIVTSEFDAALKLWDVDTVKPIGQSNSWGGNASEFFIFNKETLDDLGRDNLLLQVMNTDAGEIGSYELELYENEDSRTLSLSDEYDFRGLTVKDLTTTLYEDYEYVDRVELTGLGSGRRFVKFTGLGSFRPAFALRNITDDLIVKKFDRAFCHESSVIEFTPVSGKRYEVIVAGSERSLNKNFFLEISTTRPASPYERFSTSSSIRLEKMKSWLQRSRSR